MKRLRHINDPEIPCMIAMGLLGDLRAYAVLGRDDKVDELYDALVDLYAASASGAVGNLLAEAAECRTRMAGVQPGMKRPRRIDAKRDVPATV